MSAKKQIGTVPGLIIAGLVLWGMVKLMGGAPEASTSSKERARAVSKMPSSAAKPAPQAAQSWQYQSDKDPMSGKVSRFAILRSDNMFALDFPYRGAQHATLTLRHHPRYGFDSIVSIERGQLQCSIRHCKLQVRFDDASPQRWTFTEPESHDSTILFLRDGKAFARKVAASKRIRVELKFFQQPPEIVEFRTAGLDRSKIVL